MSVRAYDKASGKTVEVSPEAAQAGFLSGDLVAVDGTLDVTRPGSDRTGTVPAADLERAFAEGWQLSDPETNQAKRVRREESDAGSMALGAIEATASGATLGLSSALASSIGLIDPERAAARREALGGVGDALELAGAVAPAAFSGGASVGASAGRSVGGRLLAYSPAGLAARGGRVVESGVARALGEGGASLAGRAARRFVPTATGQFVEGLAYGAGAEIDESVLGNRDIAMENILAGGLMNAALGGTLGLVLPGVTRVSTGHQRVPAQAVEDVVGRWTGDVVEGGKPSSFSKVVGGLSGADAETVERGFGLLKTPEGRRFAAMGKSEHAEEIRHLATGIGTAVDSTNDAVTRALRHTEGANYMRGVTLPKGADDVAPAMTRDVLSRMESKLDEIAEKATRYNDADVRAIVDDARSVVRGGRAAVDDAGSSAIDVMRRADQVRRQIGEIEQRARKARVQGYIVDDMFSGLKDARSMVGEHLKDERLWGVAGQLQREGDTLQSAALRARQGVPGKRTAAQRVLDRSEATTPEDLLSVARKFGRDGPGSMEESLDGVFRREIDYLEWTAKHREMPPEFHQALTEAKSQYKQLRRSIESNRERLNANEIMQRLRSAESGDSVSIGVSSNMGAWGGGAIGGALGAAVAGPIGATVGGTLGAMAGRALSSPYTSIRTLAALGHMADKSGVKIDGAVGRFVGRMRAAGAESSAKGTSVRPRGTVGRNLARAGTIVGTRSMAERRTETTKLGERAKLLAANPGLIAHEMEPALWYAREHAPYLADALTARAEQAANFLATKSPKPYTPPFGTSTITDPVAEARWQRYVEAVTDPSAVLERLADGTVTSEHVEALQAVYPRIYEQLRESIVEELSSAQAEGRNVPFDARMTLGVLFDVATDPGLVPSVLLAIQSAYRRDEVEQAAAQAGPRRAGRAGRTNTKRIRDVGASQATPAQKTET